VNAVLVAQTENDLVSALGFFVGIGILVLQVYLIYAIIATRQDVRFIRERLFSSSHAREGGRSAPRGPAVHWVVLQSAGSNPKDVEDVLVRRAGYASRALAAPYGILDNGSDRAAISNVSDRSAPRWKRRARPSISSHQALSRSRVVVERAAT
jgi:hypothetical protein